MKQPGSFAASIASRGSILQPKGRRGILSRNPDQIRIIGPPFVRGEIPIFRVAESRRVTVQETKLRSLVVKIRVDVILLRDRSHAAIIEQPNRSRRMRDGA